MISNTANTRTVLCSEKVAQEIGNIFDSVLVVSQRMRELKSGSEPMVSAGTTLLDTVYREAEAGHLSRSMLHRTQKRNKNEART